MPFSGLDANAALIVIDMQKGIVALPTAHPMAGVIDNVAALCRAFRARGLPVVLVNVAGRAPGRVEATLNFTPPPDWAELIPELDRQASDETVHVLACTPGRAELTRSAAGCRRSAALSLP